MCPICLATATLATLGATSVDGLTAIAAKKNIEAEKQEKKPQPGGKGVPFEDLCGNLLDMYQKIES